MFKITTDTFNKIGTRVLKINNKCIPDFFLKLLLGIIVAIGTFPENEWTFTSGIDQPLSWVFNYIYENDFRLGENIIFPHGPLAYLMYPLSENLLSSYIFLSFLKIILVFGISNILKTKNSNSIIISFFYAYFISIIAGLVHLILANIILLFINYYNYKSPTYKLAGILLTAIAFYIKSYVAIISGILLFSFILYFFISNRNIKTALTDILLFFIFLIIIWMSMFGTLSGFIENLKGAYYLAQDNSSAASYYPYNNWWALTIFLILIFIQPFINFSKKSFFYGTLITLSVFAAWKHGMAREDFFHVKGMLAYILITSITFILFNKKNTILNLVIASIVIFLFTLNMKNSYSYHSPEYEIFKANNFFDFISNYNDLKTKSDAYIKDNTKSVLLPNEITDSIKNSSVDIYPWDYSIIPANNLNWRPRVVLQSYASYTHWLDGKNADHFKSNNAPEYFIWELKKITTDYNGSDFNSIDYRYLLNDEPQTIIELISRYKQVFSNDKFIVFKKRNKPLECKEIHINSESIKWGDWIDVPEFKNELVRVKLSFEKSFVERVKSFFYKDEQFWIYLKLKNGMVHKYKIVPKNAQDGIWINPYVYEKEKFFEVKQICFKCSNQIYLSENITAEWTQYSFDTDSLCVFNFFGLKQADVDTIIFRAENNFESQSLSCWGQNSDIQKENNNPSNIIHAIKSNSFSSTFSFPLDSIPLGNIKIYSDCRMKIPNYIYSNNVSLVLSIEDKTGNIVWNGVAVDGQLIDCEQWNNISNFIYYNHSRPGCVLKAYIWNTNDNIVYIDDFGIKIYPN